MSTTGYRFNAPSHVEQAQRLDPIDLVAAPAGHCRSTQPRISETHHGSAALSKGMDHIFRRTSGIKPERIGVVRLSHAVARAVFEIIAGYRTVSQLNFYLDPECIRKLRNQALLETARYTLTPSPGTSHGQVQSMRLRSTVGGAWECTVILAFKYRVRAVALRIEPWHGRWQVTSVELL